MKFSICHSKFGRDQQTIVEANSQGEALSKFSWSQPSGVKIQSITLVE